MAVTNNPHSKYRTPEAQMPTAGVGNFNPLGDIGGWISSGVSYVAETGSSFWYGKPEENQKAFKKQFVAEGLTPGQRLSLLNPTEHAKLGFDAKKDVGEGMILFYKELLYREDRSQVKGEFAEILRQVKCDNFPIDLIKALHQPETDQSKRVLESLDAALRKDLGVLVDKTKQVLKSSQVSKEHKLVHFALLFNHVGLSKEVVGRCLEEMPKDVQRLLLEQNQTIEDLKKLEVGVLKDAIINKLHPTVVLEAMAWFQEVGPGATVTELHQTLLDDRYKKPLLNAQVIAKEAKDAKAKETNTEQDVAASYMPGTTVERRLLNPFGDTFDHFDGGKKSEPRGVVAKEALKALITSLKKS